MDIYIIQALVATYKVMVETDSTSTDKQKVSKIDM